MARFDQNESRSDYLGQLLIKSVEWERVNLRITVEFEHAPKVQTAFVIYEGDRAFPVDSRQLSDTVFEIGINVTNLRDNHEIPPGSWRIMAVLDGRRGSIATCLLSEAPSLQAWSRSFLYAGNRSCFIVSFELAGNIRADVVMKAYEFSRPRTSLRKPSPERTNHRRSALSRVGAGLRSVVQKLRVEGARPARKPGGRTRILFASEARPAISGNLVRVRDRLIERGLDTVFDFAYCFAASGKDASENAANFRAEFSEADIILVDDFCPTLREIEVSNEQRLIQVWHAGRGFKSIGYSRFGKYGSPDLRDVHRKYTFAICGSRNSIPEYTEGFGISAQAVIPTGLPRIDDFLDPSRVARVMAQFDADYSALKGKSRILFAPTFRGKDASTAHYDYSRLDFARLYETCGESSVLLFRMHHFVQDPVPIPHEYADRLIDFSHYPDTNDLLHCIDMLVTDYSSIIYEFSLLDRPMLFYAYDLEHYASTRGFHHDYYASAPGRVCRTVDELIDAIEARDFEQWKVARYRAENFDIVDGHAADRVIDQLILSDPRLGTESIQERLSASRQWALAQQLAALQSLEDARLGQE